MVTIRALELSRAALLAVLLAACGGKSATSSLPDGGGALDAAAIDALGAADAAGASADAGITYTEPPDDFCARIAAGPAGSSTIALALGLSAANASVRFFGMEPRAVTVDRALDEAIGHPGTIQASDLDAYARALTDVCALDAKGGELGPASVRMHGGVAIVRPGASMISIPSGAAAIALDLRDLPDAPDLESALLGAVSASIRHNVPRADQRMRSYYGLPDEVFALLEGFHNIYTSTESLVPSRPDIGGTADIDRPLILLTSPLMPPVAAEIAGTLRILERARIAGHDVLARVAESHWNAVATRGLAWRYRELFTNGVRWPDRISADVHADDAEQAIDAALALPHDVEAVSGTSNRRGLVPRTVARPETTDASGLGQMRSALITAHGALHRFWLYGNTVGWGVDARIVDLLGSLVPTDITTRADVERTLRRFSNALDDAHSFVYDWSPDASQAPAGYFPVWLERVGDVAFVRESGMPELVPGDAIVAIGGMTIPAYYDVAAQVVSAATPGNRDAQVSEGLIELNSPLSIEYVRAPDTARHALTVQPEPSQTLAGLDYLRSRRHSGWLTDLGAPRVYFIQMEGRLTNPNEMLASAMEARTATAVIVDMRGYPWDISRPYTMQDQATQIQAYAIIEAAGKSPQYRTPVWTGPDQRNLDVAQYDRMVDPTPIQAPMALLVGPETQSAAEDFSINFLDGRPNAIVVGRPSSGTNGNITGINLLGGFGFAFTGMEVRFPDGRRFHGVGIRPNVPVTTDAHDLQAGIDRDLLEALRALGH
jgi:hypothetical protein